MNIREIIFNNFNGIGNVLNRRDITSEVKVSPPLGTEEYRLWKEKEDREENKEKLLTKP